MNSTTGRFTTRLRLTVKDELADLLHHGLRELHTFKKIIQQKPGQGSEVKLGPTDGNVGLDQYPMVRPHDPLKLTPEVEVGSGA